MPQADQFTPWAFRQSLRGMKLTGAQYRIAIELAEHTTAGKPAVWPSLSTLARHCAMNKRTVERALGELTNLGIITKGDGKSTRILVVQVPVHRPVGTGPQTGHTPVHRPDKYLKGIYKRPNTDDEDSSGTWGATNELAPRASQGERSTDDGVTSTDDCDPLRGPHENVPLSLARQSECPVCGCDENSPWESHAPDCPENPKNFTNY